MSTSILSINLPEFYFISGVFLKVKIKNSKVKTLCIPAREKHRRHILISAF